MREIYHGVGEVCLKLSTRRELTNPNWIGDQNAEPALDGRMPKEAGEA